MPDKLKYIQFCKECEQWCAVTSKYCRQKGGDYAVLNRVKALDKCRELSKTQLNDFSWGKNWDRRTYQDSARIFEECAKECEQLAKDRTLYQCAAVCRKCEDYCKVLAKG